MVVKSKMRQILWIGIMIAGPLFAWSNGAVAASLIYENTFNNSLGDATSSNGACYPYSLTFADPLGGSNHALRVEVRGDEGCMQYGGMTKHRSMIQIGDPKIRVTANTEYWFGFRVFVPSNYPTDDKGVMMFEMIEGGVPGETALWTKGNEFRIGRRWYNGSLQEEFEHAPMAKGKWNTVVIRLIRSWTSNGTLQVWINGSQAANWTNKITGTDYVSLGYKEPFIHMGLYYGTNNRPYDHVLYYDDLKIAKGTNGYDLVSSGQDTLEPPASPVNLQLQIQ